MVYVGIDPSYTKTGVAYIDLEDKYIVFNAITPEGRNDSYVDMIKRAMIIKRELNKFTENEPTKVMIEEPLIISQRASSLGILSGVLASELTQDSDVETIHTLNPNAVNNTNRNIKGYTSKTRKKISQQIVLEYLKVFEEEGYKVVVYNDKTNNDGSMKKRIVSSDEAEAFIMALILIRHLGVIPQELNNKLVVVNRGLNANSAINQLK